MIGNVTRDPELRYTPSGAAVCTFSIATNRTFTSGEGEKREETDFHRIVAWNKLAEICSQLIKKGNRIFVAGRLQNRSWEDQQSGQQRSVTEIVIEDMILLTPKAQAGEFGGEDVLDGPTSEATASRPAEEMPVPKPEQSEEEKNKPAKPEKKASKEPASEDVGDLDDLPF